MPSLEKSGSQLREERDTEKRREQQRCSSVNSVRVTAVEHAARESEQKRQAEPQAAAMAEEELRRRRKEESHLIPKLYAQSAMAMAMGLACLERMEEARSKFVSSPKLEPFPEEEEERSMESVEDLEGVEELEGVALTGFVEHEVVALLGFEELECMCSLLGFEELERICERLESLLLVPAGMALSGLVEHEGVALLGFEELECMCSLLGFEDLERFFERLESLLLVPAGMALSGLEGLEHRCAAESAALGEDMKDVPQSDLSRGFREEQKLVKGPADGSKAAPLRAPSSVALPVLAEAHRSPCSRCPQA